MICTQIDVLPTGMQHCRGPQQFPSLTIVIMHHSPGGVVKAQSMAGNPFSTSLIHGKTLDLMDHGALSDAALKTETVLQQPVAQHPVHD